MTKRKLSEPDAEPPRRSTRLRTTQTSSAGADHSRDDPTKEAFRSKPKAATAAPKKAAKKRSKGGDSAPAAEKEVAVSKDSAKGSGSGKDTAVVPDSTAGSRAAREEDDEEEEKSYWLMKAEPDPRFENGTDVSFSIDDLAGRTEPEPWDGIRNYVARNNLRAMKKGELAFFYHSNCKEPGIVGTMEIVQEHSPDLSAHDPKAPYYDASSKPDNPKWSVVHVRFRSKFAAPIGLKELREMGKPGLPLENMQLLKQSRLSVSRVRPAEWEYLMSVASERGGETR